MPAFMHEQYFVAEAMRLPQVVRHHDDLGPGSVQGGDDSFDLVRGTRIEVRGRLVKEQDFRVQRPDPRQRQPLLLAAR